MTVNRTASGRIPGPGPLPTQRGRTTEQRVAVWVGAVLVLACLLSIDLVFRFARGTAGELAAGLVPVALLGVGWPSNSRPVKSINTRRSGFVYRLPTR